MNQIRTSTIIRRRIKHLHQGRIIQIDYAYCHPDVGAGVSGGGGEYCKRYYRGGIAVIEERGVGD